MKFELTQELVDQIIFGMENQEREYLFDTKSLVLVPMDESEDDPEDPERYLPLPPWQSVHGYYLMERFVASLRNPIYREMLRGILISGKGVFRQFKNALKERKEIERLWYRFKEREMRKEVLSWYNTMREAWGLKEIELEFDDTEDLILSDFVLSRWNEPDENTILELDKKGFFEMFPGIEDVSVKTGMYLSRRYGRRPGGERSVVFIAETPLGDLAGFLWAERNILRTDVETLHVFQVYVLPEFRGLGLASALLHKFCEEISAASFVRVTIELMGGALDLNDVFRREGFVPFSEVLELDLKDWERRHRSASD